MASTDDQNIKTVQDIGSTIASDAAALASNLQSFWQQFEAAFNGKGGKDTPGHNLPACLQQDFEIYEKQQQSVLNDILQKRQLIGQLLSTASSLMDFQAQLSQQQIDIYSVNDYCDGRCDTVPCHLLMPDGFQLQPNSK